MTTTLAEIRAAASPATFPVERLAGRHHAAAFYCAAFLGRQDVVHLHGAGLYVVAVDTDVGRLAEMRATYEDHDGPGRLSWCSSDAVVAARVFREERESFDVVTLDPFTGSEMERAWSRLDAFAAIVRPGGLLVAGCVRDTLGRRCTSVTPAGVTLWLIGVGLPEFRCVALHPRSGLAGGCWWAVMERAP